MSNSGGDSAFDVLMAGARAAASKLKRKTPDHISNKPKIMEDSFDDIVEKLKDKILLLKMETEFFDPKCISVSCSKAENSNGRVLFIFICLAFELISEESSRNMIINIACNMLRTIIYTGTKDDLVASLCLSVGKIAPKYENNSISVLGVGEAAVIQAIAETYGMTERQVRNQYQQLGDLGLVAKTGRSSQSMLFKSHPLTVSKVFDTFHLIAKESGKQSMERKKSLIKALLVSARNCEPKYIIRLLMLKKTRTLRIGLLEPTLLDALGRAFVYRENHFAPPEHIKSPLVQAVEIMKEVYHVLPDYDEIVTALLRSGIWNLQKECNISLGVPLMPMLAYSVQSVSDVINAFRGMEYVCEYKYDGERAQIHYMEDGTVNIYSRNLERSTEKYPDIVVAISRLKKPSIKSFILDCEIVAYDREKHKILPLQVLHTRNRKNVDVDDIKVKACAFAFDILYLNGKPLLHEQLNVRKEYLHASFNEEPGFLQFPKALISSDPEEIQRFLLAAVKESYEGLVIKKLSRDAAYVPNKRLWLKLKKDSMESLWDSLDLVPIAAFSGHGKRTGLYGSYLLACYDSNNDEFQSICKTASGFSDKMLEELSANLSCKVIPKPKLYYRYNADIFKPDVWFEPSEVWVVKAGGLTISPDHCAAVGIVDFEKGLSLRNPCLICVRDDKDPEQASSSEQVSEMYFKQGEDKENH